MSLNIIKSNTSNLLRKVEKMIDFNFPSTNLKRFNPKNVYFSQKGSLTNKTMNDSVKSFFIKIKNFNDKDLALGYNLIFKNGSMKDLHNYIKDNKLRGEKDYFNYKIKLYNNSSSIPKDNKSKLIKNIKSFSENLNTRNYSSSLKLNNSINNKNLSINKELHSFIYLSPLNKKRNNPLSYFKNKCKSFSLNDNKHNNNNEKNNNKSLLNFKKINWINIRKDINSKFKFNN